MSSFKNVALNMSQMSVPQKINRGKQIADAISNNPGVFTNPAPSISVVYGAINDLEQAWGDTAGGGKNEVALMHDLEQILMSHLRLLASYVEHLAQGDELIIHLATLEVKAKPIQQKPDFEVFLPDDDGAVGLRCKARKQTLYRWEYCKDPLANNQWTTAQLTGTCSTFIGNLDSNVMYWFRVVLVSPMGETVLGPEAIVTH